MRRELITDRELLVTFLNRPLFRQIFSELFVLRIVAVLGAQALERRDHVLLAHLHRIGDHTRGLFEADASIAVSAAHTPQNVKVFFLIGHICFRLLG